VTGDAVVAEQKGTVDRDPDRIAAEQRLSGSSSLGAQVQMRSGSRVGTGMSGRSFSVLTTVPSHGATTGAP
jgi:hypothetical protein